MNREPFLGQNAKAWAIQMTLVLAVAPLAGCSFDAKARASAECDARAIEARLTDWSRVGHKNICMAAHGYKLRAECEEKDASCYFPSWQFWVKEAKLLGDT